MNLANKLTILVFLQICISMIVYADETDDLLNQLNEIVNIDMDEIDSQDIGTIKIQEVKYKIDGTTDVAWIKSRLLFETGVIYDKDEWEKKSVKQTDFFLESGLFYNVHIFILPLEEPGVFNCIIQLTDGFMYGFDFWPWSVIIAFKHLLNGNERLEFTLGFDTQKVSWFHPVVNGTPFSYKVALEHALVRHTPGWLEDKTNFSGSIFASLSPALDTGVEGNFKYYFLPDNSWLESDLDFDQISVNRSSLGLNSDGFLSNLGLFVEIWPEYRFMKPFAYHFRIAGGAIIPLKSSLSWYSDIKALIFFRPMEELIIELAIRGHFVGTEAPAVSWPDSNFFRSSHDLPFDRYLFHSFLQVTGFELFKIPLGFTSLTFNPFVFTEVAQSFNSFENLSINDFEISCGAAIALGFITPVDLFFTFGIKYSIKPESKVKFLFSVKPDIF